MSGRVSGRPEFRWKTAGKRLILLLPLLVLFLYACGRNGASGSIPAGSGAETAIAGSTAAEHSAEFSSAAASDTSAAFGSSAEPEESSGAAEKAPAAVSESGSYTEKEDVALYIRTYGKLPGNFITKAEARKLGWPGGDLTDYAPGKCIGGDYFGNHEGKLPKARNRKYYECDIGTLGQKKRGARRIIYSNDGLIYYTGDHYESYTLLYGDP